MDVHGDSDKMGRSDPESYILCLSEPTAAREGVSSSYPGSVTAPESRDTVVLLDPGAPSAAATNGGVACPDALAATLTSDVPPEARNAVSYADWLKAQLSPGAPSAAATNGGVTCPDALAATLTSDVPPEARNAVSYADWLKAQLSPGAPSAAATNGGIACLDALAATLTTAVPPTTRNAVYYTDLLTAQLSSGAASPTTRDGAAYPGAVLIPQISSGAVAPTPRNAVAYPDVLVEHFGSTLPPATWNSVAWPGSGAPEAAVNGAAFPGGLRAVATASENAVNYAIGVHDGGGYDERSGTAVPFAAQAVDGTDRDVLLADGAVAQVEEPGAAAERARGGLGLAATALAVAGLTAGGAATPATALALFAMLVAGITLVTARVSRRA